MSAVTDALRNLGEVLLRSPAILALAIDEIEKKNDSLITDDRVKIVSEKLSEWDWRDWDEVSFARNGEKRLHDFVRKALEAAFGASDET